jgi:DDE_Tnp_1-associated
MATPVSVPLLDHFAALSDPRQHGKVLYPLPEILLLVLSATIAGADDFVEMTLWEREHLAFLKRFYRYENGIPSHYTLCDMFAALDPELFKACFLAWINGLRDDDTDIIGIDGKTSRRSHDRRKGRNPLHLVSAWTARQRIVLGQQATEEKSNLRHSEGCSGDDGCHGDADRHRLRDSRRGWRLLHVARRHTVCHKVDWMTADRHYPGEPVFAGLAMIGRVETEVGRNGKIEYETRHY